MRKALFANQQFPWWECGYETYFDNFSCMIDNFDLLRNRLRMMPVISDKQKKSYEHSYKLECSLTAMDSSLGINLNIEMLFNVVQGYDDIPIWDTQDSAKNNVLEHFIEFQGEYPEGCETNLDNKNFSYLVEDAKLSGAKNIFMIPIRSQNGPQYWLCSNSDILVDDYLNQFNCFVDRKVFLVD